MFFFSKKDEYLNRSLRGKWQFISNIGIFVLSLSGGAILDPNFKVYWYTYATVFLTIDLLASMIYTFWYIREQPLRSLQSTALLGILVPVCCNFKIQ